MTRTMTQTPTETMISTMRSSCLLLFTLLAAACGSNTAQTTLDAGAAGNDVDACAGERPSSSHAGIAVVSSDYSSASLSLLDPSGALVADGCLNSGSAGVGLTATLSGDVVLPTQVPPGGPIILVDRENDVLTFVAPGTCAASAQLSVATGFHANPQDAILLAPSKAYVSRFEENATPSGNPGAFDQGDDLLIVDASQPGIVGRIDLKPFTAVDGVKLLPRPEHLLAVGGRVYVSLNQIASDFKSYGTGKLVVVDASTDQPVGGIDLPGWKNCGAMAYWAPGQRLLVACEGAYSDGPQQANTSGILVLDLTTALPTLVASVPASAVGNMPFSGGTLAVLDDGTVLAVTLGNLAALPGDRLWSLSLAGAPPRELFESAEGFALGSVLADTSTNTIFLADGTMASPAFLRTFVEDCTAGIVAGPSFKSGSATKLPPRALAFY